MMSTQHERNASAIKKKRIDKKKTKRKKGLREIRGEKNGETLCTCFGPTVTRCIIIFHILSSYLPTYPPTYLPTPQRFNSNPPPHPSKFTLTPSRLPPPPPPAHLSKTLPFFVFFLFFLFFSSLMFDDLFLAYISSLAVHKLIIG